MSHGNEEVQAATHPDPLSGAHGAHPIGVGLGTAGGAVTGAAVGSVGGPLGAVLGAVVGGVAGGLAGKEVAETFDPTLEDAYWRANYRDRPYIEAERDFAAYQPAYRYGGEAAVRHSDKHFDEVANELADGWPAQAAGSDLDWERAQHAARDAWDRIRRAREYNDPPALRSFGP